MFYRAPHRTCCTLTGGCWHTPRGWWTASSWNAKLASIQFQFISVNVNINIFIVTITITIIIMTSITYYRSWYPGQKACGCPLEGRTPCLAYPACTGLRDRGTRPSAGGEDGCNYDDGDCIWCWLLQLWWWWWLYLMMGWCPHLGEPSGGTWEKVEGQSCPIDAVRSEQHLGILKRDQN